MATSVLLGVEARLAKTDAMLLLCCVAALGVMARAYLQSSDRDIGWGHALILWTALAAGILLKGPLILMVVGLTAVVARHRRPLGALADAAASARRHPLGADPGAAVVRRHHGAGRGQLPAGVGRAGPAGQGVPGPGNARRAARLLPAAVLAHLLAGGAARRDRGALGVARAARAGDALPARLDRAELDRVRARHHQAAALRAAALSGDRDPDRARDRAPHALEQSASRRASP